MPLVKLIKKKKRIYKNKWNEREVTPDMTEMQRVIRDYYEKLYANKLDNLKEIDKSLEKENLKRLIASNKMESAIKKFPTNQSPGVGGIIGKFYQTFKEDLILIIFKLFQKM